MPADPMPSRRTPAPTATRTLAVALVILAGLLVPAGTAQAAGPGAFDKAVTRKLATTQLATNSTAARCLDSQVASRLRTNTKPTSSVLARACRLKWVRVATIRSRDTARQLAAAVQRKPALAAALASKGHLAVTVRTNRHGRPRTTVVAVGATTGSTTPPPRNAAPIADFWSEEAYGVMDTDPVTVTLEDASEDDDGQIVSRTWGVSAPDGTPVPVQLTVDGAMFTAVGTGPHTVQLNVTDNAGAVDTETATIDPAEPMTEVEKAALEQAIFDQTNAQRAAYGADPLSQAPLTRHACLGVNARTHAVNLAKAGTLYHQMWIETTAACPEPGVAGWGENVLYQMSGLTGPAVVQQWMDSPGHRANILHDSFTHIGVGIHYDRSTGRLYAAQVFYRLSTRQ